MKHLASALWTDIDCEVAEKAEVYLERSKTSPINLSLFGRKITSPYNYSLQIIPLAVGRLKPLSIHGARENHKSSLLP